MFNFLKKHWPLFLFFGFWGIYFARFWSKALFYDAQGDFWAGHVNLWGDWAAHFTMGTAMAARGLFIKSPFLLGANFSYPFVADLISGLLLNAGFPLISAFTFPSFCFSILIVVALYVFYKTIFQSKKVAVIAASIFLFNGGLGFYYFFQDVIHSATPLITFFQPIHEYTRMDDYGIKWISVIDSMIIPQRSFALGFSCALFALAMVYTIFFSRRKKIQPKREFWQLIFIGVLLGFLPLLHTHSFLASFLFLTCWSLTDLLFLAPIADRGTHFKKWAIIAVTTSLIALPLVKLYFLHNVNNDFFHWYPGWMAIDFKQNWLFFTWQNWGFTVPFALVSLYLLLKVFKNQRLAALLLPGFLIFILSNLFLFQPWSWDNTKLLVWFLLISSGLIANSLVRMNRMKYRSGALQYAKSILIVFLFFLVTASGIIDAYRIQLISTHSYMMYSASDLVLTKWARENTSVNSIWLTGDQHNHWLFNLTGRQAVMTYPGWLWTQGYDFRPVESDLYRMYAGVPEAAELLKKYQVEYVVVGDAERVELHANQPFFDTTFPVAFRNESTTIYKVK